MPAMLQHRKRESLPELHSRPATSDHAQSTRSLYTHFQRVFQMSWKPVYQAGASRLPSRETGTTGDRGMQL